MNDYDDFRNDPLLTMVCDKKDPIWNNRENKRGKGKALAGKPTLNRLELSDEGDLSKHRYIKNDEYNKIEKYFVYKFLNNYSSMPNEIINDI